MKKLRINPNGYFQFYYLFFNRSTGFITLLSNSEKAARKILKIHYPLVKFNFMKKSINIFDFKLTRFTHI